MIKRRITLLLLMVFAVCIVTAQNYKVQSAYAYFNQEQFKKAKENIDAAIEHEKTKNKAKTWYYRGIIYYKIYFSDKEEYKNLDKDALQKAYDSFQKAVELEAIDKKNEYLRLSYLPLKDCGIGFYQQGILLYQSAKYDDALVKLEMAINIAQQFNEIDTISIYITASCCEFLGKLDLAKKYYQKLVGYNFNNPAIYQKLSNIYIVLDKDTTKALQTIQFGRKRFPDDINLIKSEITIYLQTNKTKEAEENLKIAIEKEPDNPLLHFASGNIYEKVGNIEKAIIAYQNAISKNSEYFDAIFNLGALYYNRAGDAIKESNELPIEKDKEYNELKAMADDMLSKAQPFLERAMELQPDDFNTLISLKEVYARTKQYEKLKVIDAKLKADENK